MAGWIECTLPIGYNSPIGLWIEDGEEETMTATRSKDLMLRDVHDRFDLRPMQDPDFFPEWQADRPPLSAAEREKLGEIQLDYLHQSEDVMHENAVKMVVLAPLFSLAGFYRAPFRIAAEKTIKIQAKEDGHLFRGLIDVLVLHRHLWVLVVESKRNTFSLEVARPQALAYMLANPSGDGPTFGLISNGINFRLLKLVDREYAESDDFSLRNQADMVQLLQALKYLGQLVVMAQA
jgi:hypothetical protein